MLSADDITNAARVRLAELDEQAKPHEDALAKINAERAKLRAMIAAGEGRGASSTLSITSLIGPTWYGGGTLSMQAGGTACGAFDIADAMTTFARLTMNNDGTRPGPTS